MTSRGSNTGGNAMMQIEKNTVDAKNQLQKNNLVTFENKKGNGKRIMFVGNSITRHGKCSSIGWNNDWGMAASAKEKDYVHILIERFKKDYNDAAFCICQIAEWEREYKNGESLLGLFEEARKFHADIIILRLVENCPREDFEPETFKTELDKLISYLNPSGKAKLFMTTSFWKHTATPTLLKFAKERNIPIAELEDLGEDDSMKAIGLFNHEGVANHPGDKGMQVIADRIYRLSS